MADPKKTNKKPAARKAAPKKNGAKPLVAGSAGVKIEVRAVPDKGYSQRRLMPEEFPFSQLEHSTKNGNEIVGPSFFIPEDDDPAKHLARSRKQLSKQGMKFWTRKDTEEIDGKEVEGLRVWRATKEEEAAGKSKSA